MTLSINLVYLIQEVWCLNTIDALEVFNIYIIMVLWVCEHLMSVPSDYWAKFLNVDLGGYTHPPDVKLKTSTECFACW
jgi:hypothetical protein